MKRVIQILLALVIVALAYLVYDSIMKPVRFDQERKFRNDLVVERLKDIRSAQIAYKSINRSFAGDFDTLIDFIKTSQIPVVKMVPDPNDTTFSRSILDTIGFVPVIDSLYKNHKNFKAENIRFIPKTEGVEFEMKADFIERSNIQVPVFEVTVHNSVYLKGLDEQMIMNLSDKQEQNNLYPGLKLGSMLEASTDGNWE
ncbi:MAG: hypothetical protein EOL88_08195 [Bacteroidia bacterium]|nr:hypothetical protein [Bacteroidales bacterium]NCD42057.1 hypothetical protein [Bacteroidia bacterium]MDD2322215.1 hypothetical protein [Bacteroidales bacterium]MDD3009797.1 hypothetical protein [Bacteroidales bacterium]MDD3960307.1 hypothetical protein [Bacteroidales bacterium]